MISQTPIDFEYVVKSTVTDEEQRIIEGFATVQVVDRDSEILDVDSIAKAFERFMQNPVLLLHHDLTRPVGRILDYEIRMKNGAKGVWIKAQIAKGTAEADETWNLVKQGVIKAFSIRGRIGAAKVVKQNGRKVRVAEVNDLLEVSLVSVPANPEALIEVVAKSLAYKEDDELEKEEIQKSLVEMKEEILKELGKRIDSVEETLVEFSKRLEEVKKAAEPATNKGQEGQVLQGNEEIQKLVSEAVQRAVEENTQLLVLKKALGIVPPQDSQEESSVEDDDGPIDLQKFARLVKEGGI